MSGPWEAYQAPDGPWSAYAAPQPNVAKDVAQSAGTGVKKGSTSLIGMAGDLISNAVGDTARNATAIADLVTGKKLDPNAMSNVAKTISAGAVPTTERLDADRQAALGKDYQPQTGAGKFAETVGEFAPNALLVPGGVVRKAASVLLPATGSEAGGYLAKGKPYEGAARVAGALVGGLGAAAVPSEIKLPEGPKLPSKAPVPTVDDARAAKTAAYKAVEQAGVTYTPQAVGSMLDFLGETAIRSKLNPARAPKAASMLGDLQALRDRPVTMNELDQMRQVVTRDVASSKDGTERHFGNLMTKAIDGFMDNANGPGEVVGDGPGGGDLMRAARSANVRYMKLQDLDKAITKAQRQAAVSGSGGNTNNLMRSAVNKVGEKRSNWTPDEQTAIDRIVVGDKTANALRQVGKLSPSGNGLMGGLNLLSAATLGPAGAVPGAAGLASKAVADALTKGRVEDLQRIIAGGGEGGTAAQQALTAAARTNPKAAVIYKQLMGQVRQNAPLSIVTARPATAKN